MDNNRSAIVSVLFIFTIVLFCTDIYFFNYNFFYKLGITHWYVDKVLRNLSSTLLLKHFIILRIAIVLLTALTIFISKTKKKIIEEEQQKQNLIPMSLISLGIYLLIPFIYKVVGYYNATFLINVTITIVSYIFVLYFISEYSKLIHVDLLSDRFMKKARRFEQTKEKIETPYSVNIQTEDGWINIVNPFRASQVLGTPGSGKSYVFLIEAIIQHVKKGFTMLIYDYKFPDLSLITYNALQKYKNNYKIVPEFCIINFDDLTRTNRCNPLQPELLYDPTDAIGASQALMYGLYPKWAQKQGEFFTESSINFVAGSIWGLKQYEGGRYCSVPYLIQFIALDYECIFGFLSQLNDDFINNVMAPFLSAWRGGATEQLEGQIGTTRIALSRLTSPYVYYVMSDDFTTKIQRKDENGNLMFDKRNGKPIYDYISESGMSISLQINDPYKPKILCLSNNPDKQSVYAPLLSLYNTRLMKLVNKKGMCPLGMILDELPTLSFPPGTIDNLIATARSNKIAVWLGYQDFAQMERDLGKDIANAIINTVGNTFSGMVNFDTAKKLSEKFGKVKVQKKSVSESSENVSTSTNVEMMNIIEPSEISTLSQGEFVGQVADDRGAEIEQKVFYSKMIIDVEARKEFEKGEIPPLTSFDEPIDDIVKRNFDKIREDMNALGEKFRMPEEPDEEENANANGGNIQSSTQTNNNNEDFMPTANAINIENEEESSESEYNIPINKSEGINLKKIPGNVKDTDTDTE